MKRITHSLALIFVLFLTSLSLLAQPKIEYKSLDDIIKNDTSVINGKLSNGLTYYVKENKKPENRAELRIVVNTGSVLEDDDQQGLAHLCEHMCFNGTKNFPKDALVNFLESTGMRFGTDLNAATGFDNTTYFLVIPMDSLNMLDKGFQCLEDWAHNVSFDPVEVDKERGVVIEEWRLGKGAEDRIMKKQLPMMFYNSKYANRLPIGDTNVIRNASYETIKRYYNEWYRPNIMAVIAVGDFNKYEIEKKIQKYFSRLENPKNARPRVDIPIPSAGKLLVSVASDKELENPMVEMFFKQPKSKEGSFRVARESMINNLVSAMLSKRLQELTRKKDPPYLFAAGGVQPFLGNISTYAGIGVAKEDGIMQTYEALLTETFRALKHGFTENELKREKKATLRLLEQTLKEKDKTESNQYAEELQRNFLDKEPYGGIDFDVELYRQFMPSFTLEEVNNVMKKYIVRENGVILINSPEKASIKIPTEAEIIAKYDEIASKNLEPYKETISNKPLFNKVIDPTGSVVSTKTIPEIGVTEWKLSNGAKIVMKPTDFQNDQIVISGYALGGASLADDKNYYSAKFCTSIINECGVADFDATMLENMLSDKVVSLSSSIDDISTSFRGSCSPNDFETALQLLHLNFVEPRKDSEAYQSFIERMTAMIKNQSISPESAFSDTLALTLGQYHNRRRPLSEKTMSEINLDSAFNFYRKHFADVSNFTFFLVGNFNIDSIRPLIETYIGGLEPLNKKETWIDRSIRLPRGKISKEVHKGIEPKSSVCLVFTGDFEWTRENRNFMNALEEVMNIVLREKIREDKSGTYGVGAGVNYTKFPAKEYSISIEFGCDPKRVDELTQTVMDVINELKDKPVSDAYVTKAKEIQIRERETRLKENSYWNSALYSYYFNEIDPKLIIEQVKLIQTLTAEDIQKTAKKYLNDKNLVKVVLYPEKKN